MKHARYHDLVGRVALVTGASSGIGLGIAEAMLDQGMRVAVHYRGGHAAARALCARHPDRAEAFHAELGDEEGAVELARAVVARFGAVHQLVHSAGIWNEGAIDRLDGPRLEEMFRVNTFSAFYLVRELVTTLRAAAPGNVIFIGSTAGQRGEAGHSHYAASKGALQSLMMSLAVELAPSVRVNLVSPGWVRTPMANAALDAIAPALLPTLPNRRVAEVDDVVAAALFLASQASGHVVGQDLSVSGGALLVVPRGQLRPA